MGITEKMSMQAFCSLSIDQARKDIKQLEERKKI